MRIVLPRCVKSSFSHRTRDFQIAKPTPSSLLPPSLKLFSSAVLHRAMQSPLVLNDGTSFPWPVFGSGTALRDGDASAPILAALHAGFRHIDCAQMYNNEASVGIAIIRSGIPRSEIYVTHKLLSFTAGESVADSLRASLAAMRLEYVDSFLIHDPGRVSDLREAWRGMEECVRLGLAKSIGVSNCRVSELEEIRSVGGRLPAVNQIELHPYLLRACTPILDYMKQYEILPVAYSGLTPLTRLEGGALLPILDRVATRISGETTKFVSQAQVLQLWLRKKAIPYTTTAAKAERLREYFSVAELPDISDDEENQIDEVGSTRHFRTFCKWMDGP